MQKSTAPGASFDENDPRQPGAAPDTGDADAVQKTTWVVGEGTDDRAKAQADVGPDGTAVDSASPPPPPPERPSDAEG